MSATIASVQADSAVPGVLFRAFVNICVVLHAIASPDDRCHRGKHDGGLCDVDQHILALIVCWFRLAHQDVCLCTV